MADSFPGGWRPPVIRVENLFEPDSFKNSVEDLCNAIEKHYNNLVANNLLGDRNRRKARVELNEALHAALLTPILEKLVAEGDMEQLVDKLLKKETDPYTCAEEIARRFLK